MSPALIKQGWVQTWVTSQWKNRPIPGQFSAEINNDAVREPGGRTVGYSTFVGYSANEQKILALAMMDLDHAEPGTELVLTWGEPNGGSRKPQVERHRQTEVRVTVAPAPYAQTVRDIKLGRIS